MAARGSAQPIIRSGAILPGTPHHPPSGLPPKAELAIKRVDLAFLCAANWNNAEEYPFELLKMLEPRHTILIHWEDFFRDLYAEETKSVRMTNLKKLMTKLQRMYGYQNPVQLRQRFSMPRPLTVYHFRY